MKTIQPFVLLIFLSLGLSCSKPATKDEPTPADPISDTQWHGLFSYKGETTQRVFTVRFNENGSFVWQDMSGSYDGTWNLNEANDKVSITFRANGIQTSFTVLNSNELSSPKNLNHSTWTIAQLRKIEDAAVSTIRKNLPKTQWAGQLYDYTLVFDEVQAGKVAWRGGTNKTFFGGSPGPGYNVAEPVVVSDEVNLGLSYRGRFFGVFINATTLRANFWFYQAGQPSREIYNADDFIRK